MYKKHTPHFLILGILTALTLLAFAQRAPSALKGITWGLNPELTRKIESLQTDNHQVNLRENEGPNYEINFGAYDPNGEFNDLDTIAIDHYFVDWDNYESDVLLSSLESSHNNNRWPMVTVEPWSGYYDSVGSSDLLRKIVDGKYDEEIQTICEDLDSFGEPVLIRFAHEMDHDIGRYPWAQLDGYKYIEAYRYFVTKCQTVSDNFYYVWSPVGNDSLHNYWPDDDYVDFIGVSVYVYPDWEMDHFQRIRNFNEIFGEKYELVKGYGKPVIITEMGVAGSDEFQIYWLRDAFNQLSQYSQLSSVVYFNAKEISIKAWGEDYLLPDWQFGASEYEEPIREFLNSATAK